jgi:hypothetical protein
MTYDECRKKHVEKIIKEFNQKKLKLRNNTIVRDRKQAIAIALNMALRECIASGTDIKKIEKKIMVFLLEDHRKISQTRIPLTNIIETRILIEHYIKKKNKAKAHSLYMYLVKRITNAGINGIKVNNNIWKELDTIQSYL